jgi:chromosomal replication initiation ATPase DnaA
VGDVLDGVLLATNVPECALLGRCRTMSVGRARNALYAALRAAGLSYPEIGALLGRDHTTVMHGVRKAGAASAAKVRVRVEVAS